MKHLECLRKIEQLFLFPRNRADIIGHSQPRRITRKARREKNKELRGGSLEEQVHTSQPCTVGSAEVALLPNLFLVLERIKCVLLEMLLGIIISVLKQGENSAFDGLCRE